MIFFDSDNYRLMILSENYLVKLVFLVFIEPQNPADNY